MLAGPQQRALFVEAARRAQRGPTPGLGTKPQPPAAPGLSSRISPGTVPMKKGMR